MAMDDRIPIRNIYLMLCYAWEILAPDVDNMCGREKFDNIYNLLTRILVRSVQQLQKRGFHSGYVDVQESLSTLRGKINVSVSIQKQTMLKKQLICQYDELSPDVAFNQIIKATINVLIQYKDLDRTLYQELLKTRHAFAGITDIHPTKYTFRALKYNRNNLYYKIIINVCQLIFDGLISNEGGNQINFSDFIRDRKMAKLYEKFVLNFYKAHLIPKRFHVHSPIFFWDTSEHVKDVEFLPEMYTDVVVENKESLTQLIIDTKFYPEIFTQRNYGSKKTLKSSNLFQIYTYVGNSSYSGRIMGMLLYPTSDIELDLDYPMIDGKTIMAKTLNLGTDWIQIENRLLEIAEMTNGVNSEK